MKCDQPRCTSLAEYMVYNIPPGQTLALCARHMEQAGEVAVLLKAQIRVEDLPKTPISVPLPIHGKP